MRIARIAILGPESTGKSQLAEQLAGHYRSIWVREFAREYLASLDRPYNEKDVERCREGQLLQESDALDKKISPVFFDTDSTINFDVWLEEKFESRNGKTARVEKRYDFYLLTYPDLPFVADPLRENPHKREYLFKRYEKAIIGTGIPYVIIQGVGNARLKNAIDAINGWHAGFTLD